MSTFVPLLDRAQAARLPQRAREVVEYRKSGLSLNHIQGCPLDCAYCLRHTYGLWDQRQSRLDARRRSCPIPGQPSVFPAARDPGPNSPRIDLPGGPVLYPMWRQPYDPYHMGDHP